MHFIVYEEEIQCCGPSIAMMLLYELMVKKHLFNRGLDITNAMLFLVNNDKKSHYNIRTFQQIELILEKTKHSRQNHSRIFSFR